MRSLLFLLLFMISWSPLRAQWKAFEDHEGSFEVLFPEVPETSREIVSSTLGQLDFESRSLELSGRKFEVRFAKSLSPEFAPEDIVNARLNELMSEKSVQAISSNGIASSSGSALQLMRKMVNGKTEKTRVFAHNSMLVELSFLADPLEISHADGNKFLESFRWKRLLDIDLEAKLKKVGIEYSIDEEGDYQIVMQFDDENRHQVCYLSPFQDSFTTQIMVELWSPISMISGPVDQSLANKLLLDNGNSSTGHFGTIDYDHGDLLLVYSHIFPLSVNADVLHDYIMDAIILSDNKEAEINTEDVF